MLVRLINSLNELSPYNSFNVIFSVQLVGKDKNCNSKLIYTIMIKKTSVTFSNEKKMYYYLNDDLKMTILLKFSLKNFHNNKLNIIIFVHIYKKKLII